MLHQELTVELQQDHHVRKLQGHRRKKQDLQELRLLRGQNLRDLLEQKADLHTIRLQEQKAAEDLVTAAVAVHQDLQEPEEAN